MTVRGAKTLGMVPVGHDVWGEHLHKGVEEDEGVAVDVRDGLELPRLPGLLGLVLAPHRLVQHRQLPGLRDDCAQGAACPPVQGRLLEPAPPPPCHSRG